MISVFSCKEFKAELCKFVLTLTLERQLLKQSLVETLLEIGKCYSKKVYEVGFALYE